MADGYTPQHVEQFGGLNTIEDASNLPPFMSPDCLDVEFYPGEVKTRPGFSIPLVGLNAVAFMNYVKTYINDNTATQAHHVHTLLIDSSGNFMKEEVSLTPGTLTNVASGLLPGLYPNSVTHFGREYMAMGDGKYGLDLPRQYDDTNFDRVSQCGPGEAPQVIDENFSVPISSASLFSPIAISTAIESGSVITFTTVTPHGLLAKGMVAVTSVTEPLYNGTYTVLSIPSSTTFTVLTINSGLTASSGGFAQDTTVEIVTTVTSPFNLGDPVNISGVGAGYDGSWKVSLIVNPTRFRYVASTGGMSTKFTGSAASAGNIVAGVHQVSVVFETRQGYITQPAPPRSWTALGGFRVIVSNIPIGPPNVIKRILLFTAAGGASFFYQTAGTIIPTGNFIINDNTTASVTVDFSEASLLSGTSADYLFDLIELGECSNVTSYSSRLIWTGEQNNVQNFNNITFDGGFSPLGDGLHGNRNLPLGWTPDPLSFTGGGIAGAAVWGQAYRILGTGTCGRITQTAFQDYLGNPILSPSTAYKITARINVPTTPGASGRVQVLLQSIGTGYSDGINSRLFDINPVGNWVELTATIAALPTVVPADLRLVVQGANFSVGDQVWIDCIEFSPVLNPVNSSLARVSRVEDPETYSGLDGFLQPAEGVGQALNGAFVLRDFLYLVKDKSLFVTADDSSSEPANWSIRQVSSEIGSPSPRGFAIGDQWAVIASQTGLWYFNGGTFTDTSKLSQEIQPTWDAIDWTRAYLIDVKVDTKRKRIYVNVPGPISTMKLLTLDYTEGFMDPMQNNGVGRKWAPWSVQASAVTLALRPSNTWQLLLGSSLPQQAAVYMLDETQTHDTIRVGGASVSTAINGYWQSGYFTGDGRLNFGFIDASIEGNGLCNLLLRIGDQAWISNIRGWVLTGLQFHNMERNINLVGVRLAVRFSFSGLDSYFNLQGFSVGIRPATWAPTRGINAAT